MVVVVSIALASTPRTSTTCCSGSSQGSGAAIRFECSQVVLVAIQWAGLFLGDARDRPGIDLSVIWPDMLPLCYFPHLLGLSLIGCLAGRILPNNGYRDVQGLLSKVRPGVSETIRELVIAEDPDFVPNRNFGRDWVNVIWESSGRRASSHCPFRFPHEWGEVAATTATSSPPWCS